MTIPIDRQIACVAREARRTKIKAEVTPAPPASGEFNRRLAQKLSKRHMRF